MQLIKLIIILILFLNLSGCGLYKKTDAREVPVNVNERVKKNVEEGRGIRFRTNNSGGTFDFASSNELWRATVDTLDFVPLVNASYSGGIIITDWFNDGKKNSSSNIRELKITIKFLSNEIRSDSLEVILHEKICEKEKNNCSTSLVQNEVAGEIKLAILKKAAFLEKNKIENIVKENRKKRPDRPKSE
jgi:hypothetical protein